MFHIKKYRTCRKYKEDLYGFLMFRLDDNGVITSSKPVRAIEYVIKLYLEQNRKGFFDQRSTIFRLDLRTPKRLSKRESPHMHRLILRNRFKYHFDITNKQIKNLMRYVKLRRGIFLANFHNYFEGRLDILLIKHYFFVSIRYVRNVLDSGSIVINDFIRPRHRYFSVKVGDVVSFNNDYEKSNAIFRIIWRLRNEDIKLQFPRFTEISWRLLRFKLWTQPGDDFCGYYFTQLNIRELYNNFTRTL